MQTVSQSWGINDLPGRPWVVLEERKQHTLRGPLRCHVFSDGWGNNPSVHSQPSPPFQTVKQTTDRKKERRLSSGEGER